MGLRGKRDDVLSMDEVEAMINIADNIQVKAMVSLLWLTGCRVSELLLIRKKDFTVDVNNNRLLVNIITLKTRKKNLVKTRRTLPISLEAPFIEYVIDYFSYVNPEDRMFPFYRVKVWRMIKELNPSAWVHLFRDTRNTRLAEQGVGTHQLMVWNGWTNSKTANEYVRRSGALLDNIADKVK